MNHWSRISQEGGKKRNFAGKSYCNVGILDFWGESKVECNYTDILDFSGFNKLKAMKILWYGKLI